MAEIPPEPLNINPPFTNVGLDVFGPWMVRARCTRGGHAESKRWAILFTCMSKLRSSNQWMLPAASML